MLEASSLNLLRLGILLMMTYTMKNCKIKVKLLLKTKFSIFFSVNTNFQDTFAQCFSSLLMYCILHWTGVILKISFDNALLTSFVYILGDLTDCALGWWVGCGEGVVFRVCWECVVCCERRVLQGFFLF